MRVNIIGAGIGGLSLALELHDAGIECTVFEAAPRLEPLGVGINLLPHATQVLSRHGLLDALAEVGIVTSAAAFYNRFGQVIHREPAGLAAGFRTPQFSLHRGDLQAVLTRAVLERLGPDGIRLGHHCHHVTVSDDGATASFRTGPDLDSRALPDEAADLVVGCDGIHSVVRRQLHPNEGPPRYSGVMMWRGVTTRAPFLDGATMARAGWLTHGKLVVYPVRTDPSTGAQLVNWVAEVTAPERRVRTWDRAGSLDDFRPVFADWHFDWLDVPAMFDATDTILEYPMVDQDPLPHWGLGPVTLLGDAAHPMVPRGSNGAGQAILDARALRDALVQTREATRGARQYESTRLPATSRVVLANRTTPPDMLLHEVWKRTGDKPFHSIDDVITPDEIRAMTAAYEKVAGLVREGVR